MRTLIILSVAVCVCLSSCRNGGQKDSGVVEQGSAMTEMTAESQDTLVIVTETSELKLYKPVYDGGMSLSLDPVKADDRVFIAAAAYTKSYDWSAFDHDLIAGPHIDEGFYDGYTEPAVSGAFYYVGSTGKWGFAYQGYDQALMDIADSEESAVGFSQVMLLYDGVMCTVHANAKPYKLAYRRALCNLGGELYVIDSKYKVAMYDFAACLKEAGVIDALYMDMGSMRYSLYREVSDGEWLEIYPANSRTKYCTNYLVFYCAD